MVISVMAKARLGYFSLYAADKESFGVMEFWSFFCKDTDAHLVKFLKSGLKEIKGFIG